MDEHALTLKTQFHTQHRLSHTHDNSNVTTGVFVLRDRVVNDVLLFLLWLCGESQGVRVWVQWVRNINEETNKTELSNEDQTIGMLNEGRGGAGGIVRK